MIKQSVIALILIPMLLSACSMVQLSENEKYHTLGVATVKHCESIVYVDNKTVGVQCTLVETGPFSGWEALAGGIAEAVVKIFTFGLVKQPKKILKPGVEKNQGI